MSFFELQAVKKIMFTHLDMVQLTLSSLCPLFRAVLSINLSNIKRNFLGTLRIEPKAAGWEASILPLCYAAPPPRPPPPQKIPMFCKVIKASTLAQQSSAHFVIKWSWVRILSIALKIWSLSTNLEEVLSFTFKNWCLAFQLVVKQSN